MTLQAESYRGTPRQSSRLEYLTHFQIREVRLTRAARLLTASGIGPTERAEQGHETHVSSLLRTFGCFANLFPLRFLLNDSLRLIWRDSQLPWLA